ncbi:hypothetical protein [Nostoc sp.]
MQRPTYFDCATSAPAPSSEVEMLPSATLRALRHKSVEEAQ